MQNKKNDYIVVRRINMLDNLDSWEEFESTVRAYMNKGYELVGGISISNTGGNNRMITVAQSLIANRSLPWT